MQKEALQKIIEESIAARPSLFLIAAEISPTNQIKVVIDDDQSVSVKDCVTISREIEHKLDREQEDFSLEVTSAGVSAPLQMPRQYKKNVGRKLAVKTANEKYEAQLVEADENGIELQWKQREPKPIGKGKHTVQKQVKLTYSEIIEAKVMITF